MEEGPSYLDTVISPDEPLRLQYDSDILDVPATIKIIPNDASAREELDYWKEEVLKAYEGSDQKKANDEENRIKDALKRAIVETMREESAGKIGRRFILKAEEGNLGTLLPNLICHIAYHIILWHKSNAFHSF